MFDIIITSFGITAVIVVLIFGCWKSFGSGILLSFCLCFAVAGKLYPILDCFVLEMVCHMVKPVGDSFYPSLFLFKDNDLIAETTPETTLEIPGDTVIAGDLGCFFFSSCVFCVGLDDVIHKIFLLEIEETGAEGTSPTIFLLVLALLVSFPIVFGAESFVTAIKGTAKRSLMPYLVFLELAQSRGLLFAIFVITLKQSFVVRDGLRWC